MQVYIQDKTLNKTILSNRDFIGEGGEGKIYGKGELIYKIYFNSKKVIPQSKIDELKRIEKDNILVPKNIITDTNGLPIGITMKWIKNSLALCKLFTSDFRKRFNIQHKNVLKLIENMVKDINFIHKNKCLIVDGNEMNYLIKAPFINPFFIDIDSYQTSHFPATAIAAHIMDYHSKEFNELTDWFSFGILAIQLFIGIHPYKGIHLNYKRYELEQRMKDNVSIFNKDVKLPASVRDFSHIPDNYLEWFIKIFEKGKRLPPPSIIGKAAVVVKIRIIRSTKAFNIELINSFNDNIIRYQEGFTFTRNKVYFNKREYNCSNNTEVIFTKKTLTPILVDIDNRLITLKTLNGESIPCMIQAQNKTIINNMLFILNNDNLLEVNVDNNFSKVYAIVNSKWNVLPNATTVFNGIVYQNVLGVPYLLIPYKSKIGKTSCDINPINELKGYRILEAKHDSRIAIIIGERKNKYFKFTIKYNEDYTEYEIRIENTSYHIPNFVTLDNGIVISITPDDAVEIFNRKFNRPDIKRIEDKNIDFNMKLCKKGIDVYLFRDKELFKISMNK